MDGRHRRSRLAPAEVPREEPVRSGVEGQAVAWLHEPVALVMEQQVLVRHAAVPHRRNDPFGLVTADPRIAATVCDQNRDTDVFHA
jgi:hypothetical protein